MKGRERRPAKRALFIVITDYPGGAERVAFSLAAELASRPGWASEVMIVCSRLPNSFTGRALPPSVRVSYGLFRNWFLAFPLLPFRLLLRRSDLICTTHVYTNALLSAMRGLGLIRTGRLVVRESTSLFDRFTGWKKRLFVGLYRAYGKEDLLIAQTGYMADHIRPWLTEASAARIRVFPNPVNMAEIERGMKEPMEGDLRGRLDGRLNVLHCGRLEEVKRPGAALEAFAAVAAHHATAQLVYLGDGTLEHDLRHQASDMGIADRVLFLGFQTNPYLIMAACHYGLVTSAREGFPNVVLEMMACGLRKIIVTPCAGDLDQLSGVTITKTFESAEIGAALNGAIESGEVQSQAYRSAAAARSVPAYVDQVLGRN